jgi:hypothetical protein
LEQEADPRRGANESCTDVSTEKAAIDAARRLFAHLERAHLREDGELMGPDPGVSLNLRFTRFLKSYARVLPWRDHLYYLQAQAYWIIDNIELHKITGLERHRDLALRCAQVVVRRQRPEGYWDYPQAEWKGRVATVEGCFGALGLLEAYSLSSDQAFLDGATRWYDYMLREVGFQEAGENGLAVNYFSNVGRGMVPNNATLALWLEAALCEATGDERFAEHATGLINFLAGCQLDSGELPYVVGSDQGAGRDHYLCFQYNAFQFLDLAEYYRITGDDRVVPIMRKLGEFISQGLTIEGDARHDCSVDWPRMHYFTAAVSAALTHATHMGLGEYPRRSARGCGRLVSLQRRDGGYDYSLGDYGFLSDRRSYPRNQAMILRHLIVCSQGGRLRVEA